MTSLKTIKKQHNTAFSRRLPAMIGLLQASEAIKIAAGIGSSLVGRLLLVDLLTMDFKPFVSANRRDCPVCSPSSVMAENSASTLGCA